MLDFLLPLLTPQTALSVIATVAVSLLVVVYRAVLRGDLVSAREHAETREDRDAWRKRHETLEHQLDVITDGLESARAVIDALPKAPPPASPQQRETRN